MSKLIQSNPLDPIPAHLKKVEGINRLKRSIDKELSSAFDEKCSNLPHLLSVVQSIQSPAHANPSAVLKSFPFQGGRTGKMTVDVVSQGGDEWCKVSARNPRSLQLLAAGGGGYGQKSILDHAQEYLDCARENLCLFKPPKVTFVFASGIGVSLAERLQDLGVNVEGVRIEDEDLDDHERIKDYKNVNFERESVGQAGHAQDDKFQFNNPDLTGVTKLNLDITALLAYVSNLTNGHTSHLFKKPILAEQRQFEVDRPQKPILDSVFQDRDLYCSETAMQEFKAILEVVGGPEEKNRAEEFMKRVTVVPDQISPRSKSLVIGGHIKKRSLVIFGTGDSIQAVTVTANSGFVRSARSQGVDYPVFVHESRALTEGKEDYETMQKKQWIKSADFLASDLQSS